MSMTRCLVVPQQFACIRRSADAAQSARSPVQRPSRRFATLMRRAYDGEFADRMNFEDSELDCEFEDSPFYNGGFAIGTSMSMRL